MTSGQSTTTFPAAAANPPGPLPVLMTPGPSAKNTISYPPALGQIFPRMPRPLSLGPAGPTAGPTPLPLQLDLLAGPPVSSTPVSAVPTLAPVPTSSQATVTPSLVPPASSTTLPNVQAWMRDMQDAFLSSEHHHGFRISPGQSEWTVAPGPGALQVIGLCPAETGGRAVYLHRLTTFHHRPNGWEAWALTHDDAQALPTSVGAALVPVAIMPHLPLLTVAD